jgi:hypothetical protein
MFSTLKRTMVRLAALGALLSLVPQAKAMPNWARKYGVSCSTCHTAIPALNETGYDFRKAGFRMSSEIYRFDGTKADTAKLEKPAMENLYTARIQANFNNNHTDTGTPANNQSTNQVNFYEVTFYPISGSFGKHLGSLMELSLAPGGGFEIENAYVRYTAGNPDSFWNARVGVFHPFEGFGASDRPMSIDRPFMQTNPAKGAYFKPWGFDQSGVEVAYVYKRTTLSLSVFTGLLVHEEDGKLIADPAQGGDWNKKSSFKNYNTKDIQLFFNQILSDNGSGISAYYYTGKLDQPLPGTAPDAFTAATSFENSYKRTALYGSWVPTEKFRLLGGYQTGEDTNPLGVTYKSKGYFGEVSSSINEKLTVGTRFDRFQPTDLVNSVDKKGITAYANMPFQDGWQMIAQVQKVDTDQGVGAATKKENKFQLRLIWIF